MKRVLRADILRRLETRFNLEDLPGFVGMPLTIARYVQLVSQVDELLKATKNATQSQSVTAIGWKTLFTVPAGKRWAVHLLQSARSTGSWTLTEFGLFDVAATPIGVSFKKVAAAASLEFVAALPIPAEENWTIRAYVDAFTSTGDLLSYITYREEDAF